MKNFEATFIVKGNLNAQASDAVLEAVKDQIKQLSGVITYEKRWGSRKLAYLIQKQDQAYYFTLQFDLKESEVKRLDQFILRNKDILRHLLIKSYKNVGTIDFEAEKQKRSKARKEAAKAEPVDEGERQAKLEKALEKILEE